MSNQSSSNNSNVSSQNLKNTTSSPSSSTSTNAAATSSHINTISLLNQSFNQNNQLAATLLNRMNGLANHAADVNSFSLLAANSNIVNTNNLNPNSTTTTTNNSNNNIHDLSSVNLSNLLNGQLTTLTPLNNNSQLIQNTNSNMSIQAATTSINNNLNLIGSGGGVVATNTGLLDLIMCKLVAPYHVVNDPRMLDCGASACHRCIASCKDAERNLKCPYCNGVHKIPLDSNKLIVNKNLQSFIKINLKQINDNFSKQLEDSMFALERKKTCLVSLFIKMIEFLRREEYNFFLIKQKYSK